MNNWKTVSHSDVLRVAESGAATWVELARPAALNAFDYALQDELRRTMRALAENGKVRAVALSGSGRAFSAGADLSLNAEERSFSARTREELDDRYNPIVRTIRDMPKPVVAAVHGPAIGIGCAIAIACDQVVASQAASFLLAFSRVGLTLDGGASLLVGARVGIGRASRMALLAESIDASTALEWGLVDEIADDAVGRATSLAVDLAAGPTIAFARTKANLNSALLSGLDDAFRAETDAQSHLVDTADFREGVAAFAQKRVPNFGGAL
ncbi:enoyl-CoA hydratase-related protein [Rhodococcus erythropolis]|uniref:enoyl-CoA hydratase/isomerase family protein n=1 Tax=Rhodococcus erythropolis TaxID=1833 RepID=UPI00294901F9|nr:enoyl-CoA hydratase-related protein [Rhodococcus erythropolis]MDV6211954.1 enoyl-CoA hydratase-related protein [Rhodococcus erythropolis]